ncbi:peptide ABC transporter substrate-binding protein [Pseudoclostridium thermosuccinogenes]|uniref:peptide ABC transporter substrate-binding protein n=1 Tax=Clostridium thermosuccinogenes TaxID=84032 RepID=UPI002FDB7827
MRRVRIILLAAIIFLLSACSGYNGYEADDSQGIFQKHAVAENGVKDSGPVKGGVLNLFSTKPDTLNPLLTRNVYVKDFLGLIFEGLFRLNRDQKPVPVLADNWEVTDDGLVWTIQTKDGVLWHDGMPLTAHDVHFTLEAIQNGGTNSIYKKNVENIAAFTVIDRKTLRIFLKEPDSFFLERLTFPILPGHYFMGEDVKSLDSEKNMSPLGTGPYKYVSGGGTDQIKLVANEKWWNSENEENPELSLPYIQEIDIKVYDSEKDALSAFQTGEIDVMPVQTGGFVKYSRRSDINIIKYTDTNYEFIAMNLENPVLGNKAVRQAIACSIDKTALINEVIPGEAVATDIPIIPYTWLNNTNVLSYTPNKALAREILAKAGWVEENGIFCKRIEGKKRYLKFELMVNKYNKTRSSIAQEISKQLKDVGIEISVLSLDWEEEMNKVSSGKFDMALMGYRVASVPDVSFAYASVEAAAGFNVSRYKNQLVDIYLGQIKKEMDPDSKKALFLNMKNIIIDEVPHIGLYFYNSAVLYSKRIKGEISPYVWNRYDDIVRWYIPEKL